MMGSRRVLLGVFGFLCLVLGARSASWCGEEPQEWVLTAELTGSEVEIEGRFGDSVAISGNRCIVGSPGEDVLRGAAYVFERQAGAWVEIERLVASDRLEGDSFGVTVALDGDVAFVSAPGVYVGGAVYAFRFDGVSWVEEQKLQEDDNQTNTSDRYGDSICLVGDEALVGVPGDDTFTGEVVVFRYDGANWNEEQKVTASDHQPFAFLGESIARTNDFAIFGAPGADGPPGLPSVGAIYVFQSVDGTWSEVQKLHQSDAIPGAFDFGISAAASDGRFFVGDDFHIDDVGAVYVFEYQDEMWVETQKLVPTDVPSDLAFGRALAATADVLCVGAPDSVGFPTDERTGAAYVFTLRDGSWQEAALLTASVETPQEVFGAAMAASEGMLLISGPGSYPSPTLTGKIYEFRGFADCNDNDTPDAEDIESATSEDCNGDGIPDECLGFETFEVGKVEADSSFGDAISLDREFAFVGVPTDGTLGTNAGAVYVLRFDGETWAEAQKLLAGDGHAQQQFGCSVSLRGDTGVIGAMRDNEHGGSAGAAYVFHLVDEQWVEDEKLVGTSTNVGDQFGRAVAAGCNEVVVGAPLDDNVANGSNSGAVFVFRYDGAQWVEEQRLLGSSVGGTDNFGAGVALDGDALLVGSPGDDTAAHDAGCLYAFRRTSDGWEELDQIVIDDVGSTDRAGSVIGLSADRAAIGVALYDGKHFDTGLVLAYQYDGTAWVPAQTIHPATDAADIQFGASIALTPEMLVVGAPRDSFLGEGKVHMFRRDSTGILWEPRSSVDRRDGVLAVDLGRAVAVDGVTVLASGKFRDSSESTLAGMICFVRDGDCDRNGTLDRCEIDSGTALDANSNGVPDSCEPEEAPCERVERRIVFRRGDADGDGTVVPLMDAMFFLNWRFLKGETPGCQDAADVNADNQLGLLDVLGLLYWKFQGGPPPPAPGPDECGEDPDEDSSVTCLDPPKACE